MVDPCTWKIEVFREVKCGWWFGFISHCTSINFWGLCLWVLGNLWGIEKPWSADVGILMRWMNDGHGSEAVGWYCNATMDHRRHYCRLTFSMLGWLREIEKFMIKHSENENTSKMLWLMIEENNSFVLLVLSYILPKSLVYMQLAI